MRAGGTGSSLSLLRYRCVSTPAQFFRRNRVAISLRDAEICESRRDSPTWAMPLSCGGLCPLRRPAGHEVPARGAS